MYRRQSLAASLIFRIALTSHSFGLFLRWPSRSLSLSLFLMVSSSACTARTFRVAAISEISALIGDGCGTSRSPVVLPMYSLKPTASFARARTSIPGLSPAKSPKSTKLLEDAILLLSLSDVRVVVEGRVLGMSRAHVTPPHAAASEPVPQSSFCVMPGPRQCKGECM